MELFARGRISSERVVVKIHEMINSGQVAAKTLTALHNLKANGVAKVFRRRRVLIDDVNNDRVSNDGLRALENVVVIVGNSKDWLV